VPAATECDITADVTMPVVTTYSPALPALFAALGTDTDPATDLAAARKELHSVSIEVARLRRENGLLHATVRALSDLPTQPAKAVLARDAVLAALRAEA